MLDIGWGELMVIGVVALIVVGPKDLPGLFRTVGHFMGRARGMAREFQRSMEAAADDSGLNEVSRNLKIGDRLNLNTATNSARKYAQGLVRDVDAAVAGPGAGKAAPKVEPAPAEALPAAIPPAVTAGSAPEPRAAEDAAAR